jgi:hypothetical protein
VAPKSPRSDPRHTERCGRSSTLSAGAFFLGPWHGYRIISVVELDKQRRVGLFVDGTRGSSGRGEYHYVDKLEPSDGGTDRVLDARMEDMGILGAIFGRLFSGSFKKAIKKDIDGLKNYLENDESGESA